MLSAQETKPCESELQFLSRILETDVCLETKKDFSFFYSSEKE